VYRNPLSQPYIDSIQGCATTVAATHGVAGCKAGDVITILGGNFQNTAGSQVQVLSGYELLRCSGMQVQSPTVITCVLPYVTVVTVDSVLPIRVIQSSTYPSNWLLAIDYQVPSPSNATTVIVVTESVANHTALIISLSVTLPLIVLLLFCLYCTCWRLYSGNFKLPDGAGDSSSRSWFRHRNSNESDSDLQMGQVN